MIKKGSDVRWYQRNAPQSTPQPHITHNSTRLSNHKFSSLESYQRRDDIHKHMCTLSCSRVSPVLMKHSPYPLSSLLIYSHKWVWWGSVSQANRVWIVLLHSYLPLAIQLSVYEDTGGVLSVFSPWIVAVFDCYSHLRQRLCKCFCGAEIKLREVFRCFCIVTYDFRHYSAASLTRM